MMKELNIFYSLTRRARQLLDTLSDLRQQAFLRPQEIDRARYEIMNLYQDAEALVKSFEDKNQEVSQLRSEIIELQLRLADLDIFERRSKNEGGVFISYSHSDKKIVNSIVKRFEKDQINYWLDDKDLLVGQVIDKAISDGIQNSWIFILVLSPDSVKSKWVEREFDEASYEEIEGKKAILPIVCNGLKPDDVPARIRRRLYVDLSNEFDSGYKKLKKSVIYHLKKHQTT